MWRSPYNVLFNRVERYDFGWFALVFPPPDDDLFEKPEHARHYYAWWRDQYGWHGEFNRQPPRSEFLTW